MARQPDEHRTMAGSPSRSRGGVAGGSLSPAGFLLCSAELRRNVNSSQQRFTPCSRPTILALDRDGDARSDPQVDVDVRGQHYARLVIDELTADIAGSDRYDRIDRFLVLHLAKRRRAP
jgi:hypothetical protein